jgi:hypothetical protein
MEANGGGQKPHRPPATRPAEADLQRQVAQNQAEVQALRDANRRQQREIAELLKKLNDDWSDWSVEPKLLEPHRERRVEPAPQVVLPPGKIKARRTINGIEYATVSLGAKQRVEKGMKLKVMDGEELLGTLTIDLVETDESVGHLDGATIDKIKKGSDVKG